MHSYSTASSVSSSSRRRPRPGTSESSNLRTPLPSAWSSTASVASSSVVESSSTNSYQRRSRRPALILDASTSSVASEPPPSTTAPLFASPDPENSTTSTARRRLWPNWTGRRATTTTTSGYYQTPLVKKEDTTTNDYPNDGVDDDEKPYNPLETAAHFSRHATTAGYLTKLDSHTQQHWKRRFCVLQPATHLYYFWSPTDTEPRGCCHVDDANVSLLAPLPDGRTRIVLEWDNQHEHAAGDSGSGTPHRVLLEARSPDVAQAWHNALTTQSYSHIRQARDDLQRQYATAVKALREAQQKATAFQSDAVEAAHTAAQQKADLQALDEGVRQLSQRLTTSMSTKTSERDTKDPDKKIEKTASEGQAGGEDDDNKVPSSPPSKQSSSPSYLEPRDTSLLDQSIGEGGQDDSDDAVWDPQSVPGPSFAALFQVCTQLQEHLRWANLEAQTAVEDAQTAQQKVQQLSKRGAAAEAQLLQMWEENCALRKSLQQKKREKKVLVREVRKLQAAAANVTTTARSIPSPSTTPVETSENDTHATDAEDEEDQLMEELEEHVMSSIRLHEQIMAATPKSSTNVSTSQSTSQTTRLSSNQGKTRLHAKPSLLDDFSSDDEDDESFNDEISPGLPDDIPREDALRGESESLSSVQAEASVVEESSASPKPQQDSTVSSQPSSVASTSSQNSTLARPNPIVQLDALANAPLVPMTPIQQPITSVIQAEATTNLASSLTKATDRMRMPERSRTEATDDLKVYHLTFYSRKIGLQFQKVPPPPAKPKGLLTDAFKADFVQNLPGNKSDRTAVELRMIASLSHQAKMDVRDEKKDDRATLQAPVDAVLVCGFSGFDESGANVRPKLGARLVAFDGVSVEVGPWTFDSIRKAILSRSRPLTLSFRNEYLTMEQREILTRAVKEANHHRAASRRQSETTAEVSSDLLSSAQSIASHESGSFVNQNVVVSVMKHPSSDRHEMDSVSVMTERSMGPETPLPVTLSAAAKRTPYSFRSFSDVGSSTSSVLSAVGPLMAHLLPPRTPSKPFTPDYLVSKGQSVEETPEHADFASSLL